jgi:hypothetical protein
MKRWLHMPGAGPLRTQRMRHTEGATHSSPWLDGKADGPATCCYVDDVEEGGLRVAGGSKGWLVVEGV